MSAVLQTVLNRLPGHWARGQWHTLDGCRCLLGWLVVACNPAGNPDWNDEFHRAAQVLARAARVGVGDLSTWNDESTRTEHQVVQLLQRARRMALADEALAA